MPSTTPGWRVALVLARRSLLLAAPEKASAISNRFHFGANYRIQRPTLHLATFPQLRGSRLALGVEFPLLTLSIVSWVPSYTMACLTHFDEIWDG